MPEEVIAEWRSLLKQDTEATRKQAESLYFESILPTVLRTLEAEPEHIALREMQYHTLVSLMGFSPETTVISTAIVRPQRLVVVYSHSVGDSYDRAYDFLNDHGILRPRQIVQVEVNPVDHYDIYRKISALIGENSSQSEASTKLNIVDVTGGKKIMSATAAQVAWELNMPLCYVESRKYDPSLRRPLPGYEQVIRLSLPSREKGRQRRRAALHIYGNRNYPAATEAFAVSRTWNENRVLDEFGMVLCPCYAAWADLDLTRLSDCLVELTACVQEQVTSSMLENRLPNPQQIGIHLEALRRVAKGDALGLLATYFELAQLYREQKRFDFSCLLAYRSMEALIEYGLRKVGGDEFRTDAPNYDLLGDREQLKSEYQNLCAGTGYSGSTDLPRKIGLLNGFGLLCIVSDVNCRLYEGQSREDAVHLMKRQAERRNRSVLAHGNQSLSEADCSEMLRHAERLAGAILTENEPMELRNLMEALRPVPMEQLNEQL